MSLIKLSKEILFIAATHGNEKIGVEVLQELSNKYKELKWLIANERAYEKNIRCVKNNMNRIAPGNIKSSNYESRRVAEVVKKSTKFRYVVDIHGTDAGTGIFAVVTNPTKQNIALAKSLPIKNIVIWQSQDKKKTTGPLTNYVKCGVEIECGSQNSPKTREELTRIIEDLIKNGPVNRTIKNIYEVYGKLYSDGAANTDTGQLKEFKRATINGESFYPLLINRYPKMICYKMRKISPVEKCSTLVFLDIDGTLLDYNYCINYSGVIKTIKKLRNNGYIFVLNSNRALQDLAPIATQFTTGGPIIYENGIRYYWQNKDRPILKIQKFSVSIIKYLKKYCSENNYQFIKCDTVKYRIDNHKNKKTVVVLNKYRRYTASIYAYKNGVPDYGIAREICNYLKTIIGCNYSILVTQTHCNVLVVPRISNKFKASKRLIEIIKPKKTIAIGDELADAKNVENHGDFFAVNNASTEAKKQAKYISPYKFSKGVDDILKRL